LKVALSGLGGDEMFGGYSTFRSTPGAKSVAALARNVPFHSWLGSTAEKVSTLVSKKDAHRKMAALWHDPNFLPHPYFYTRLLFTPTQVHGLMSGNGNGNGAAEPWEDWLAQTAMGSEQLDDFTAVSCLESRSYMVNTLLRDTDAMSMANSLEVRVPFLDHPIVEYLTRLPGSIKRTNGTPKSLLVDAMGDMLPREVVCQPKRTFTLPWEHWLRGPLKKEMEAEFNSIAPSLKQCLDERAIGRVWKSFLQGKTSWSRVWSLFVLNRWARRHLEN
jgi:asparagine synthase (glutamine-hydrolysing)